MKRLAIIIFPVIAGCTLPRVDDLTFQRGDAEQAVYAEALTYCSEAADEAAAHRQDQIERRHIAFSTMTIRGFPERRPLGMSPASGAQSISQELDYVRSRAMIECMEEIGFSYLKAR